ncbi:hypothetical protein [Chryseobacterium sp.]|uniref:hypothetical protein n=1 Tax=Chryseobacterium sp. TaxID=1871047 RepID=UPI0012BF2CC4|nr:hypothetical protein [Chryseobacterium sp.]MPS64726.1 hypothetical protein [Chryseobacterium sp.]
MRKNILCISFIISIASINAQVKLYNTTLPYFNKAKLVKPAKTVRNVNRFTNRPINIIEYNSMGQLHGVNIEYRNDSSVGLIRYYHNNTLVYSAQPFMNGNTMERIYNYSDNGSYDGTQIYTYLDGNNKWITTKNVFSNGRLIGIDDKLKFPQYTVNFNDGKLNGEFYFYDSLHCSCYYYGNAIDGKIKKIMQLDILDDLSFKHKVYVFNDKSIKSTFYVPYRNAIVEDIEITNTPVIVENNNVHLANDNLRIVFDKQLDWMQALMQKSIDSSYNADVEKIDLSDATFGAPSSVTIPQNKH